MYTSQEKSHYFLCYAKCVQFIVGETASIVFDIVGDYMPEIRFFKGKREIKPGNKTKFNVDAATKKGTISLMKPKFVDEGKYSIQLVTKENTVSDDANFNIFVKGKQYKQFLPIKSLTR